MNELQVALVVIGVLAIAGVLIYNRMQERKYRQQAEAGFVRPQRDALIGEETDSHAHARRIEPGLAENIGDEMHRQPHHGHEPHFGDVLKEADLAENRANMLAGGGHETSLDAKPNRAVGELDQAAVLRASSKSASAQEADQLVADPVTRPSTAIAAPHDELIEYRVRIKGESIAADMFGEAINHSSSFVKPVRWLGLPLGGRAWEELLPWSGKRYQEVMVAMQLADRNGAARGENLVALCEFVGESAAPHGLKAQCDELEESLERARSLDLFCVDVDVLIGLNVVARGDETLPMSKVKLEAGNAGMVLAADGTFQLRDNRGEVLYALCNHESMPFSPDSMENIETHGVTLLFDVPRVPDGIKTFNSMVALGRKLAHEVGGLLVDDNLRPLTDAGIDKIRAQLSQIYNKMEARGIPAGGRLALRLFS